MAPPTIVSAFLSARPLEPVLVFETSDDAAHFQSRLKQGRILYTERPGSRWVYLPMPDGLMRVRTAAMGDIAFEFDSRGHASAFNESIKGLGKIFPSTKDRPIWDRTVYLGQPLK